MRLAVWIAVAAVARAEPARLVLGVDGRDVFLDYDACGGPDGFVRTARAFFAAGAPLVGGGCTDVDCAAVALAKSMAGACPERETSDHLHLVLAAVRGELETTRARAIVGAALGYAGTPWPALGLTMVDEPGLRSLVWMIDEVIRDGVKGHVVEAGV
ncbi:hypothetical protein M885DRAFT_541822 [Pelagophyceae sp. CCMP2097]|nr:hypothetical protein M885DRAFT_541822 [Pelagophyceae sp. CCMP2097]